MKRKNVAHCTDCEGFYRRDFLKVGVLGLFGLGMADLLRLKAFASPADGRDGAGKVSDFDLDGWWVQAIWICGI